MKKTNKPSVFFFLPHSMRHCKHLYIKPSWSLTMSKRGNLKVGSSALRKHNTQSLDLKKKSLRSDYLFPKRISCFTKGLSTDF